MNHIATIDIRDLRTDGQAKAFDYTDAFSRPAIGIILRYNGELRAYRNCCPHWSIPLDAGTGQFFDDAGSVLECQVHGARFLPGSGECVAGPCDGQRLEALRVKRGDDEHTVEIYRGRALSF